MAKRSHRSLSKKGLPPIRRVTNKDGVRTWQVKTLKEGIPQVEEIATLREVVMRYGIRN